MPLETFDATTPPATEDRSQGDDRIREFKRQFQERWEAVFKPINTDPPYFQDRVIQSIAIALGAVVTELIADLAVTTPKLADDAVSGSKIADNAIGLNHIPDGLLTEAKLVGTVFTQRPLIYAAAASPGTPAINANNHTDVGIPLPGTAGLNWTGKTLLVFVGWAEATATNDKKFNLSGYVTNPADTPAQKFVTVSIYNPTAGVIAPSGADIAVAVVVL